MSIFANHRVLPEEQYEHDIDSMHACQPGLCSAESADGLTLWTLFAEGVYPGESNFFCGTCRPLSILSMPFELSC